VPFWCSQLQQPVIKLHYHHGGIRETSHTTSTRCGGGGGGVRGVAATHYQPVIMDKLSLY